MVALSDGYCVLGRRSEVAGGLQIIVIVFFTSPLLQVEQGGGLRHSLRVLLLVIQVASRFIQLNDRLLIRIAELQIVAIVTVVQVIVASHLVVL